jgi:predicted O-linked N-acetylglucosamine transferase (SPINDLY family)
MNPQRQLLLQQAIQAFQSGNLDRADSILKRVLQADSKNLPALHILGLIRVSQKNHREAADLLGQAVRINPNDPSIRYNLAKALLDCGLNKESIPHHKCAVELDSNNSGAWFNYGVVLSNLGNSEEAIAAYDEAIKLNPTYDEALFYKGVALYKLERFDEALASYDKVLELNSNYHGSWYNKGLVLFALQRYEEAIAFYNQAIKLHPTYYEAFSNKAVSLLKLKPKRYEEALSYFDRALSLQPSYLEALIGKGLVLQELKQYEEALTCFDKALSLNPDFNWLHGDFLHTKMQICEWNEFVINGDDEILSKALDKKNAISPFPLLGMSDDAELQLHVARLYAQAKCPSNLSLGDIEKRPQQEKIRIGYFSADFHNHATGHLMAQLFELHDKNQFEIIGFSFGPAQDDEMRSRLIDAFDQFIEVGKKGDKDIAQLSRELSIDIAVDLKGFTHDSRPGIFSYRAAPIQVSYLGFPGTMGADFIDFIIADETLIPRHLQKNYSEKVVYLPNSYQVNDGKKVISDRKFLRQELGLPEGAFVFCCFNNCNKILPATFDAWMRILHSVDESVLWLLEDSPIASDNLKLEAEKRGISGHRMIFAKRVPLSEHLARHHQADLFIDTFPCNAHTTASDALWSGLPVLTLMGESFASRVGASLLHAVGLPELVTSSQTDYESLAIELAKDHLKLEAIKSKLVNNRLTYPLFNTPIFTHHLETAFIKMHENYLAGLPSEHIYVDK